jgi:hypothetical protein
MRKKTFWCRASGKYAPPGGQPCGRIAVLRIAAGASLRRKPYLVEIVYPEIDNRFTTPDIKEESRNFLIENPGICS